MECEYIRPVPGLPGKPTSLWIDTSQHRSYPSLQGAHEADVVVIGGGLAGVLTAALLREAGRRVALVEARRIGCNATGHTTAKVTVQHAYIYRDLVEHLGEYEAITYAESNLTGLNLIASLVHRYRIDCDFHRTPFHLFALDDGQVEKIRAEAEVTRGFGLPVTIEGPRSAPFGMPLAMRVEHQAVFHPLKFVHGLLERLAGDGLEVFENTRALDVDDAKVCTVTCEHGEIRAPRVVVCTQFPMYDHGAFFSRLYPYSDYALAIRLTGTTVPGMFHDAEHYGIRTYPSPGDPLLILSGGSHKAGQGGDERKKYVALSAWGGARYGTEGVEYHWSTEDYYTPDGMPFIGASPGSGRVFLATGFGAWGMTNSAVSALLNSDLVLGKGSRWAEVYDPSRTRPRASWREFLKENLNVAGQMVSGKLAGAEPRSANELRPGQGAIVWEGGRRTAAYKDGDGAVHALSPSCTHMGCEVSFNEAELTWDCPCHGSRFGTDGQVLYGPAKHPLERRSQRP